MHPNEPKKLSELETIRKGLLAQACTVEVAKQIGAIESQIARRKLEMQQAGALVNA